MTALWAKDCGVQWCLCSDICLSDRSVRAWLKDVQRLFLRVFFACIWLAATTADVSGHLFHLLQ